MTSSFTERLFISTKENHMLVDKHPFTALIKNSKDAGNVYINFNKICIFVLQNTFDELIDDEDPFYEIYKKLYRPDVDQVEFFISSNLSFLLERCEEFPIEHAYLFYLGLLMGGNILSKSLPQHQAFLSFGSILESKKLIQDFKQYLNDTIKTKAEQDTFISRVNVSYRIIKLVFDDYYKKITSYI